MSPLKKPKIYRLFLWGALPIVFTNCIFYKTITVPVNTSSLSQYLTAKPIWTIRDVNHRTDAIHNIVLRNDSIFGKLSSDILLDHPENKSSYRKGKGVHSKDYLHIYTNSSELSNDVKLPLSGILFVSIHENDRRKNIFVNALLSFVALLFIMDR